jgi:hypothetical protein
VTQVWSGQHEKGGEYLDLFNAYPSIRTPRCLANDLRFANLGGVIGTPAALHDMADWVLTHYPDAKCILGEPWANDQACLHRFVLEGMDRTSGSPHLDCGRIFFPMWNVFVGNIYPFVHLNDSNTLWPSVFHTNGHVVKPLYTELRKCLTREQKMGFPIELERSMLKEEGPVAQQILLPLCRHLRGLFTQHLTGAATLDEVVQHHDVFELSNRSADRVKKQYIPSLGVESHA